MRSIKNTFLIVIVLGMILASCTPGNPSSAGSNSGPVSGSTKAVPVTGSTSVPTVVVSSPSSTQSASNQAVMPAYPPVGTSSPSLAKASVRIISSIGTPVASATGQATQSGPSGAYGQAGAPVLPCTGQCGAFVTQATISCDLSHVITVNAPDLGNISGISESVGYVAHLFQKWNGSWVAVVDAPEVTQYGGLTSGGFVFPLENTEFTVNSGGIYAVTMTLNWYDNQNRLKGYAYDNNIPHVGPNSVPVDANNQPYNECLYGN